MKRLLLAALFTTSFTGQALAQALPPTITKVFNPSTVFLGDHSDATITVTNPNAFPIPNVQLGRREPTRNVNFAHWCRTIAPIER